jgi:hypothetical protein
MRKMQATLDHGFRAPDKSRIIVCYPKQGATMPVEGNG